MGSTYVLPGQASAVNNGQLIPWYRPGNYYPRPLRANGPGGISSAGSANPAFPPQSAGPGFPGANGSGGSGAIMAQQAGAAPFSPVKSPVVWIVAFLIVSFLLMRFIHHGY